MAFDVIMPKAGMAMEEGVIIRWLKKEGEAVESGEPLLEIETDKVSMEVESPASGVLLKILAGEGETVPVTRTIGYIGRPGETLSEAAVDKPAPEPGGGKAQEAAAGRADSPAKAGAEVRESEGGKIMATPLAKKLAAEKGIDLGTVRASGRGGEVKARDVERQSAVRATPLARKIAQASDIDLSAVAGSGVGGKIMKDDLPAAKVTAPEPEIAGEPGAAPLKGMRKVIAERMAKSHAEIPPVTLNARADVTELLSLRAKINDAQGVRVTINDLVLKAAAAALREMPDMNAHFTGGGLAVMREVNLGVAVAIEGGLIVPVIQNADTLSLRQISEKSRELAAKARSGKLLPDECSGGTFTVSNLGMYGILSFTPIINQPEIAILGVCAVDEALRMVGGKIENRSFMGLSLTFDHRAADGARAAALVKRIRELLENPLDLLV